MYLPYIRAKQHDLAALVSLDVNVYSEHKVIPIVEPISSSIRKQQYENLLDANIPFILVVNPIVGTFKSLTPHQSIVTDLVTGVFDEYENYTLGFIIHPETTLGHITNFIQAFPENEWAFIHFSQIANIDGFSEAVSHNTGYNIYIDGQVSIDYMTALNGVASEDVLIRDGFNKRSRNQDYPDNEFFFDLHKTYRDSNFQGFGDFTIIGKEFTTGGGPAHVVALHLSDTDDNDDIVVYHFKSDLTPPITPANPAGKFSYALRDMSRHLRANPALTSTGITEYKKYHRSAHYPGLGIPKKLSIMHHIELMHSML